MDKVLFNVVFNRKKRLLKNGTALIQIEAYLKGKKKYFSTNIYIKPDQWNAKHKAIKNHPNQISLNKQISNFANKLESIELKQRASGKPFSLDYLVEFLKGNCNDSFIDFYNTELRQQSIKQTSVMNHLTAISHLKKFRKSIEFKDIDFAFLTGFEKYLQGKGMQHNTIWKNLTIVRRYVNLAIDRGYMDINDYPFRKFKIKAVKTNRSFLTPEEIEKFEDLRLTPEQSHLQLTLDKFLFAIYTGLRFSDVSALQPKHLTVIDGKEWLVIDMKKTEEQLRLPVYTLFDGKALDIFYKYVGSELSVFEYQNNYVVNNELKEITAILGIKKKVTFHVARHTQATYLLYKGVNLTTVQKLLGHKHLETTQVYGKVMDMTIVNELQNVSFSR